MTTIKIAVHGVLGKMGQEVANMVCTEPDFAVAGVADVTAQNDVYDLPDGSGTVKISDSLENVLDETDVIVDFTNAEGAMKAIRIAAEPFRFPVRVWSIHKRPLWIVNSISCISL